MFKQKFDRLLNTNKKTGDPSCSSHIRRAKHIARSIVGKACAKSLSFDEDVDIDQTFPDENYSLKKDAIGESSDRLSPGKRRLSRKYKKEENDSTIVDSITDVAKTFKVLTESFALAENSEIKEVVRNEGRLAMSETIREMRELIESIKK